jgi:outer membrane protein TolC
LRAAQAGYRGERARLWATTLEQQLAVVRSYFDVLQAQRLREVTEQTIAFDREQVSVADSRFGAGRATKNDLLIAQVAMQNAEQELVLRDLQIAEARWRLNQAIGAPINAPTQPLDVHAQPEIPLVDEALRDAYLNNPLLTALLEEQQRAQASLQALQRSRLARLQVGAAIDYSSSDITQPQEIGSAFTGFTWDLGTDLRREAQIAETRLALDQSKLRVEQQLRDLEAAIRATHQAVAERLAALRSAQTAVSQAEENLRIRRQQYDAGRAQSDDVLRAEAVLAQQRAILASALYQAHTRRAELQQLVGLPLDELLTEER